MSDPAYDPGLVPGRCDLGITYAYFYSSCVTYVIVYNFVFSQIIGSHTTRKYRRSYICTHWCTWVAGTLPIDLHTRTRSVFSFDPLTREHCWPFTARVCRARRDSLVQSNLC